MTKLDELVNWFEYKNKVMVALSGGVDSALVAYAAFQKLGNSAIAVTADYKTLSEEETSFCQTNMQRDRYQDNSFWIMMNLKMKNL